jgi:hypothetical protein
VRAISAWVVTIGLAVPAVAAAADNKAPSAEAKAGARAAATRGVAAFDEKRYADALDLFTRAESLMHAPTHILMMARSEAALGKLVRAQEHYAALAREPLGADASTAFKQAKADGAKELEALQPRVPTLDVKLSDPAAKDVAITLDGKELPEALVGIPHPVDPGKHTLSARGEDVAADEISVELAEGAHVSRVLKLHPAPHMKRTKPGGDAGGSGGSGGGLRIGGYVTVAAGVVGLGVGAAFVGLGFAKRGQANEAYEACGAAACVRGSAAAEEVDALDKDANLKQTVGLVGLIAGGVLAGAGIAMIVVGGKPAEGAHTSLVVGPGTLGLSGTF